MYTHTRTHRHTHIHTSHAARSKSISSYKIVGFLYVASSLGETQWVIKMSLAWTISFFCFTSCVPCFAIETVFVCIPAVYANQPSCHYCPLIAWHHCYLVYVKFISQCLGTAPIGEACPAFNLRRERESPRNSAWLGIKRGFDCELRVL